MREYIDIINYFLFNHLPALYSYILKFEAFNISLIVGVFSIIIFYVGFISKPVKENNKMYLGEYVSRHYNNKFFTMRIMNKKTNIVKLFLFLYTLIGCLHLFFQSIICGFIFVLFTVIILFFDIFLIMDSLKITNVFSYKDKKSEFYIVKSIQDNFNKIYRGYSIRDKFDVLNKLYDKSKDYYSNYIYFIKEIIDNQINCLEKSINYLNNTTVDIDYNLLKKILFFFKIHIKFLKDLIYKRKYYIKHTYNYSLVDFIYDLNMLDFLIDKIIKDDYSKFYDQEKYNLISSRLYFINVSINILVNTNKFNYDFFGIYHSNIEEIIMSFYKYNEYLFKSKIICVGLNKHDFNNIYRNPEHVLRNIKNLDIKNYFIHSFNLFSIKKLFDCLIKKEIDEKDVLYYIEDIGLDNFKISAIYEGLYEYIKDKSFIEGDRRDTSLFDFLDDEHRIMFLIYNFFRYFHSEQYRYGGNLNIEFYIEYVLHYDAGHGKLDIFTFENKNDKELKKLIDESGFSHHMSLDNVKDLLANLHKPIEEVIYNNKDIRYKNYFLILYLIVNDYSISYLNDSYKHSEQECTNARNLLLPLLNKRTDMFNQKIIKDLFFKVEFYSLSTNNDKIKFWDSMYGYSYNEIIISCVPTMVGLSDKIIYSVVDSKVGRINDNIIKFILLRPNILSMFNKNKDFEAWMLKSVKNIIIKYDSMDVLIEELLRPYKIYDLENYGDYNKNKDLIKYTIMKILDRNGHNNYLDI